MVIFFCVQLAVVLLAANPASAEEIEVNSAALATKAIAAAKPGDAICLADGIYKDFQLTIEGKDSADRPITFRAKNSGKATLTEDSALTVGGKGVVVEGLVFDQAWREGAIVLFRSAQNCRLTDCAFIECGIPRSTFGRAIDMISTSTSNRVDHCYMQGNISMGMGVKVGEPDNLGNVGNTFDRNYFRDIVHRSSNGQESVQLGQGGFGDTAVRAIVEFNLFERANGDPEIISNKSAYNIMRYNTFRDCDYGELTIRGGKHTRVEGNFFFGCKGGVRVYGADHQIVNNYMEGCERGITLPFGDSNHEPASRILIAHNTIVNAAKVGLGAGTTAPAPTKYGAPPPASPPPPRPSPKESRFANNIVISAKGALVDSVAEKSLVWEQNIVFAQGKAKAGLKDAGVIEQDPKLEKVDGLWRLPKTASPAIGSAKPVKDLVLSDDIDGQPRKGALDVGCDQVSDAPILRRPLEPKDVGPAWMKGDPSCIKRIANPKPIPPVEKAPAKKKK